MENKDTKEYKYDAFISYRHVSPDKEIAEKLFLSDGTVRNYLSSILEKLELRDRTQLAVYYYKNR